MFFFSATEGFVSSTGLRLPCLSHLFLFRGWPWATLCDLVRPIIRCQASGCNRGNGLTPCFNSEKACTCLLASCSTLTSVWITLRREVGREGERERRERGREGFNGSEDARVRTENRDTCPTERLLKWCGGQDDSSMGQLNQKIWVGERCGYGVKPPMSLTCWYPWASCLTLNCSL